MAETRGSTALERVAELSRRLLRATDLDARLTVALEGLAELFEVRHAMVFVPCEGESLTTIASHGYPPGGVGARVPVGLGTVGVAAERRRPVRLSHLQRGLNMLRAIHQSPGSGESETRNIPFVGIVNAQSQLAMPVVVDERLLGVLYAEDTRPGAFGHELELVVEIVANALSEGLQGESETSSVEATANAQPAGAKATRLAARHYEADSSVFFDGQYVIKSLPGSILWKLLCEHAEQGRAEFTLKELRLDPALQNHAGRDNLDARLILLRRRLEERFPFVRIVRTGRGRFRLEVERELSLERC